MHRNFLALGLLSSALLLTGAPTQAQNERDDNLAPDEYQSPSGYESPAQQLPPAPINRVPAPQPQAQQRQVAPPPLQAPRAQDAPETSPIVPSAQNSQAARSVHLWWAAPPAQLATTEMTIDDSTPGSYFMALGFGGGYFGLQELPDKKRVAVFSVWDNWRGDNPDAVTAPYRVEVLAPGDGVETARFGGEGTGVKATWPMGWKNGRPYRFLIRAVPDRDRIIYSAYVSGDGIKDWKLMASMRAPSNARDLRGLSSFIEDFRRDGKSVLQSRKARFGQGWVQAASGQWLALTRARFGADSNTQLNINAGIDKTIRVENHIAVAATEWFLQTGGVVKQTLPLGSILEMPPIDLPVG